MITSFWLLPLSSLLIISNFWEIFKFTCLFFHQLVYSSLGLFKPSLQFYGLNKVQITQDKVLELVQALEVTKSRTSSLGATFLKCQAIRSAGLSGARLKKFYYKISVNSVQEKHANFELLHFTWAGILSRNNNRLKLRSLIIVKACLMMACSDCWDVCRREVSHVSTLPSARTARSN